MQTGKPARVTIIEEGRSGSVTCREDDQTVTGWGEFAGGDALALVVAALFWIKEKVFSIHPGDGTPVGRALRTEHHIAQLIRTLEPYAPSLRRDPSKDRCAWGPAARSSCRHFAPPCAQLLLLQGGAPAMVPSGSSLQGVILWV